jgi:uncharacterized repeat protein (TIGR01451 family)
VAALLLVPLLLLLLGAATAAGATPATLRLLDMSPGLGRGIAVAAPGGGTFTAEPGHAVARITPQGGAFVDLSVWCVDARRGIQEDHDYDVTLQTAADDPALDDPWHLEAAWLIGRADGLMAAAADPGREAAAIQIAVWQLTGQAADIPAVTADAALNARVAALRALAAGRRPAVQLALTGPAGSVTAGAPATVVVTGTPGTEVALRVASGTAALSAASVTLDAAGRAQVTVTPAQAGQVTVAASAAGGVLWRATHQPENRAPQDMAYLVPTELTASATVTAVVPAAPTTPVPPTAPPTVAPTGRPSAVLGLVKRGPARVLSGVPVTYTLRVTNRSAVRATAVVVRDALPSGTVATRVPAGAAMRGGTVLWRVGDLAPGRTVTLHIRLRVLRPAGSVVRNAATASASNARTVRARTTTRILPLPAAAQPAVTG